MVTSACYWLQGLHCHPGAQMAMVPFWRCPAAGQPRLLLAQLATAASGAAPDAYILGCATLAMLLPVLRWLHAWWRQAHIRRACMQISSPLSGTIAKLARSLGPVMWQGFCPCCKRPLDLRLCEQWKPNPAMPWAEGQFAYVINLWGSSASYVLGALVLGHSIRRTKTRHALVCLHTDDVPPHFLALLAKVWDCRCVGHVESTWKLSVNEPRFEKVFTKLRGMSLTEFEKILVLDIDMLVRANVDELFELMPPAAMKRGMNNGRTPYKHGDTIDARCFFQGKDSDGTGWSWGVGTGINAGTMLWQPDTRVLRLMLEELCEPNHPSHICGAGPEQDYLSRYWADAPWSHIGVEYNFQLHHMFNALNPDVAEQAERVALLLTPEKIKIVHYSGAPEAKPWSRVLDPRMACLGDAEYTQRFAEEFLGYWLWIRRDSTSFQTHQQWSRDCIGMYIGPNGEIYRRPNNGNASERLKVPEQASEGAMALLHIALHEWFEAFQELQRELGVDLQKELTSKSANPTALHWDPLSLEAQGAPFNDWPGWTSRATDGREDSMSAVSANGSVHQTVWDRARGSWWVERSWRGASSLCSKATVVCGAPDGGQVFVSFVEGGTEVFWFQAPNPSSLVFLKVAGPNRETRRFSLPAADAGDSDWAEALASIHSWVEAVEEGDAVLVAMLEVTHTWLGPLQAALCPLGVPALLPPLETKVFAAVGYHTPQHASPGSTSLMPNLWYATYASVDVAYAAIPWPQPVAAA